MRLNQLIVAAGRRVWHGLGAGLLGALLGGCEPPAPRHLLLAEGFEQAPGRWTATGKLSREQAHSGQQAIEINHNSENQSIVRIPWGILGQPHHIRMRVWVWLPDSHRSTCRLIAQMQRQDARPGMPPLTLHFRILNIPEVVRRYRRWVPVTLFMSLPSNMQPTDELVVDLWTPAGQPYPVYLDDFAIENLD